MRATTKDSAVVLSADRIITEAGPPKEKSQIDSAVFVPRFEPKVIGFVPEFRVKDNSPVLFVWYCKIQVSVTGQE